MKLNVFVLLITIFFSTLSAYANIGVLPSRIEAKIPPTKSYENVFTINNKADSPTKVRVMWRDRSINPLVDDWLQLSDEVVEIPAGGTVEVGYKLFVPEGSTGEYNAWVIFTGEPIGQLMGANLSLRISIPVYVAVKGAEQYDFKVKNLKISNKNPAQFSLYLINTGNVHIRPKGEITVIAKNNKEKYSLPFNKVEWAIIPREGGEYIDKFDAPFTLPDGEYTANLYISAGEDHNKKEFRDTIEFQVTGEDVVITEGLDTEKQGNQEETP